MAIALFFGDSHDRNWEIPGTAQQGTQDQWQQAHCGGQEPE